MTLPPQEDATDAELFACLNDENADEAARERAAEALVLRYDWLVRWATNRYAGRGEQRDELSQVGYLGLVEAVRRFDAERGVDFVTFARPTVLGEIRRHFRDGRRWIRLPRRIQELKMRIREATDDLHQELGHPPSVDELAEYLEVPASEVEEAIGTDDMFTPVSLDTPVGEEEDAPTHAETIGEDDAELDDVIDSESLWPLLDRLPEREREMLLLRFYGNKTQSEIAEHLGISQMHVSRLLSRTLKSLRDELVA
ncbi:MAG TPA: SigB/SigF/SigG family RNA polymerase sigma factor [Streptosporangiales bacterium]